MFFRYPIEFVMFCGWLPPRELENIGEGKNGERMGTLLTEIVRETEHKKIIVSKQKR